MLYIIEKYRLLFAIIIFILLIGCSILLPTSTPYIGVVSFVFILCTTILTQVSKHRQAFHRAEITDFILKRNIAIDTTIIILVYLIAGFLGRWTGFFTSMIVDTDVSWTGSATVASFLSAILAAFIVGFLVWRFAYWAKEKLIVRS